MPEYRCQNCGHHFFGRGTGKICPKCGGKLEPANEVAEEREIHKRQETN